MDTRRSYYLACRQDDFAEAPAETLRLESYEILYAAPANDNSLSKSKLPVRCWKLFRSLVAGIGSAGRIRLHQQHPPTVTARFRRAT